MNAFTSPGLIAFVERKLAEEGADVKLIPPAKFLKEHSQDVFSRKFHAEIEEQAWELLGLHRILESLEDEFRKPALKRISKQALTEAFGEHPEKSWRNAVDDFIEEAMEEDGDDIEIALKEKLEQSVAQFLRPSE